MICARRLPNSRCPVFTASRHRRIMSCFIFSFMITPVLESVSIRTNRKGFLLHDLVDIQWHMLLFREMIYSLQSIFSINPVLTTFLQIQILKWNPQEIRFLLMQDILKCLVGTKIKCVLPIQWTAITGKIAILLIEL